MVWVEFCIFESLKSMMGVINRVEVSRMIVEGYGQHVPALCEIGHNAQEPIPILSALGMVPSRARIIDH